MLTHELLTLPPAVAEPLVALHAVSQILICADEAKWNTIARPPARELAALMNVLHERLTEALIETNPQAA